MARWLVVLALLAVGCGDPADSPDASPIDSAPPIDGPPPPGFPEIMSLAASQVVVPIPFTVDAAGSSLPPLGRVAMTHDVGTVELDGTAASAFVYMTVPFVGYDLYQGFAVGPSRWDVFWLYCQNKGLAYIYDEGVGGPELFYRDAAGTCTSASGGTAAPVALPALAIPPPAPFRGYTVTGANISVAVDGTGMLTLDGRNLPLVVFGEVDCSTVCGGAGWFELHSIVWDGTQQRAIFVIVYLQNGRPNDVLLTYARSLPDLGDPIGTQTLPATWTTPRRAARTVPSSVDGRSVPFGVPPPALP